MPHPPPSDSSVGSSGAGSVRSRLRGAARQAAARVGPVERAARKAAEQRRALRDLLALYDGLRRRHAPQLSESDAPATSDVAAVRAAVDATQVFADFVETVTSDGDMDRAAVTMTRRLMGRPGGTSKARSFAQVLQRYPALRPIADICLALCAVAEPMPEPAWMLFSRNDLALIVRWAAEEYFRLGFARDPGTASAALARVLAEDVPLVADPHVWLEIACSAFAADVRDLAAQALDRAERAVTTVADARRVARLRTRAANLRSWLEQADRAAQITDCPAGEIPFALVGFGHPDWNARSRDLVDPVETLAALGHLVRHRAVTFTGEAALVDAADRLRADVPPDRLIDGDTATVRLYQVDRDVSRHAVVPDGTWTIVSDWFAHPLDGTQFDVPLDARLRPIFVSFHITPTALRAPGAADYLREHAPIGCRDWDTVLLLRAAGIPAFRSGPLVTTLDTVLRPATPTDVAASTLFVDVEPDGPGERRSRLAPAVRERDLGANLTAAAADMRRYRDTASAAVTADPRFFLALRAVGCRAELRIDDPGDYLAAEAAALDDGDLATTSRGIADKLAAVLAAVVAGRSVADVYETWRHACAADVAAADAVCRSFPEHPGLSFDLGDACNAIRSTTVISERSAPGPGGPEINVEFSVDENYKHQLDVVLDSVVQRSSRPVRAFVLCRGYGPADFTRMAALFPTVSFVWLQTDRVDYGNVRGKIKWATTVTMDRTILPELLPDVDRIVHVDLDALCMADLAELFDVDMAGACVAAVDEPQPNYGRGFDSLRDSARLLRREGHPELAREYLIRTASELEFDFDIFNAGVMVLDLAALRASRFCARYLPYVERFGINGQRVLNVGVGRARTKLDPDWNRLVRLEVTDEPKIAHWAGPFKPWPGHPYVPGRDLWRAQEEHFAARSRDTGRAHAAAGAALPATPPGPDGG